ncbi:hypothetical protein O7627_27870 [Solwaraspora sp. WMMD1047]|uniref:hypothetical protein n=1 Tax=Solwaraspora sp. WMMD1047 TaxID=3016102 RepID=UPI00241626B5|nr:hypothetical protein [Solwaraspora sp. WMMD1047]MDG4833095.1 hypothetical protein [Solwaraspora sp. WMMD1047]
MPAESPTQTSDPISSPISDLIGALDDGDERPLRQWLADRLIAPAGPLDEQHLRRIDGLPLWNAEENRLTGQAPVLESVQRLLATAATVPDAAPLFVLYLKHWCDEAWESAWYVEPVLNVMRHAGRCWAGLAGSAKPADPELTGLAVRLLEVLDGEMATFNAGSCGSLAEWGRLASRTAELASALEADAAAFTETPVGAAIAGQAGDDAAYYRALAGGAYAVHRHFAGPPADPAADDGAASDGAASDGAVGGSAAELARAVAALRAAEERLPDGVARSELRAHRYNVEALAAAADRPWLRLDHGKVVYLYPFGLYADTSGDRDNGVPDTRDLDAVPDFAEQMVDAACRTAHRWTVAGWRIADQPHLVVEELLLDDIWKGDDPLGRQYSGMAVALPDLTTTDVDRPGAAPATIRAELRLSRLGNHYLRLECELSEATPPEVYAAMLRAAPEFGDLVQLGTPLRPADDPAGSDRAWRRLSDFATEVIGDAAGQLATHSGLEVRASVRPGMYHVLVSVDRGALVPTDGGDPVPTATAYDAAGAIGAQQLCHPVRHGFSSLAEWLRYPVQPGTLPVVDVPEFAGDLLLRTCNTTLVVTPGTPDYMLGTIEETAEFVASLDGMFAGWQDQVAEYYSDVKRHLARMVARLEQGESPPDPADLASAAYERDTRELVEMQGRLEAQQLRLHQFVMASRLSLMFVTSPALVTSPVVRTTIDKLLEAAKFDALRRDFEGMIDQVLGDRIGTLVDASVRRQQERNDAMARALREEAAREADRVRREEEHQARLRAERERIADQQREIRERSNRRRNDVLLGGIAAVGLSGVMQIVQAGYSLENLAAALLAVLVLVAAIGFSWVLALIHPDRTYAVAERRKESAPAVGSAGRGDA